MVYCYDISGNFIREFNSIKKASETTKVSRSQIKNICDLNFQAQVMQIFDKMHEEFKKKF